MSTPRHDLDLSPVGIARRNFIKGTAVAAAATTCAPLSLRAAEPKSTPESLVKVLYDKLNEKQRQEVCFDWDHIDKKETKRGLLRTRVQNNWSITKQELNGDFYTPEQRDLVRKIFEGIVDSDWVSKFDKQLEDDCGGFGEEQSIAIFGKPGDGNFEFVLTGRHMTLRCDGNSAEGVAFGGPIFYGHAPTGADESADHKGNVFWPQALEANKVYSMLDGKQRKQAEVAKTPREQEVAFRGKGAQFLGIPVTDLASDQRDQLQKTLQMLLAPFRQADRAEATQCLTAQGGLEACYLSFFTDQDIGKDKVWDNWRLEGPSFVWHFRGSPHVHVWVNVADRPEIKLNA
ncbi:MAG: DUF3500 domain-containing protein [Pirellulaceae bacterium]|nr:DUF3500 domain-containing protein [Pirellulaceae bacterium]